MTQHVSSEIKQKLFEALQKTIQDLNLDELEGAKSGGAGEEGAAASGFKKLARQIRSLDYAAGEHADDRLGATGMDARPSRPVTAAASHLVESTEPLDILFPSAPKGHATKPVQSLSTPLAAPSAGISNRPIPSHLDPRPYLAQGSDSPSPVGEPPVKPNASAPKKTGITRFVSPFSHPADASAASEPKASSDWRPEWHQWEGDGADPAAAEESLATIMGHHLAHSAGELALTSESAWLPDDGVPPVPMAQEGGETPWELTHQTTGLLSDEAIQLASALLENDLLEQAELDSLAGPRTGPESTMAAWEATLAPVTASVGNGAPTSNLTQALEVHDWTAIYGEPEEEVLPPPSVTRHQPAAAPAYVWEETEETEDLLPQELLEETEEPSAPLQPVEFDLFGPAGTRPARRVSLPLPEQPERQASRKTEPVVQATQPSSAKTPVSLTPPDPRRASQDELGAYLRALLEKNFNKKDAKTEFDATLSVTTPRVAERSILELSPEDVTIKGVKLKEIRAMGGSMSDLSGYKDLSKAPLAVGEEKKELNSALLSSALASNFEQARAAAVGGTLAAETFAPDLAGPEVDTDFNGNFQTLIRLINELPEGVTKQTGAQIIRLTMESMGIFMEDVLSDAQAAQSEMLDAVRANIKKIEEYKTIIRKLETDIKYYQGKANELSEIIDLFILSNTSSKVPTVDELSAR